MSSWNKLAWTFRIFEICWETAELQSFKVWQKIENWIWVPILSWAPVSIDSPPLQKYLVIEAIAPSFCRGGLSIETGAHGFCNRIFCIGACCSFPNICGCIHYFVVCHLEFITMYIIFWYYDIIYSLFISYYVLLVCFPYSHIPQIYLQNVLLMCLYMTL